MTEADGAMVFKLYAIHNRNKDVFPTEKDSTPTPKCYSPIPLFAVQVIITKIAMVPKTTLSYDENSKTIVLFCLWFIIKFVLVLFYK